MINLDWKELYDKKFREITFMECLSSAFRNNVIQFSSVYNRVERLKRTDIPKIEIETKMIETLEERLCEVKKILCDEIKVYTEDPTKWIPSHKLNSIPGILEPHGK